MKEWEYLDDILLEVYFPASLNFWCGTNIDLNEWQKKLKNPKERRKMKKFMDNFDWSPLGDPDWMEEKNE